MISLRVCLPSKFNLTHVLVGIFLETTAALCKQMSITTDLMDFPQKSNQSFFMRDGGKGELIFLQSNTQHLKLPIKLSGFHLMCRFALLYNFAMGIQMHLPVFLRMSLHPSSVLLLLSQ